MSLPITLRSAPALFLWSCRCTESAAGAQCSKRNTKRGMHMHMDCNKQKSGRRNGECRVQREWNGGVQTDREYSRNEANNGLEMPRDRSWTKP